MYLVTSNWSGPNISNMKRLQSFEQVVLYLKVLHKKDFSRMSLEQFVNQGKYWIYRTELGCPIQPIEKEELGIIKELLLGSPKKG